MKTCTTQRPGIRAGMQGVGAGPLVATVPHAGGLDTQATLARCTPEHPHQQIAPTRALIARMARECRGTAFGRSAALS